MSVAIFGDSMMNQETQEFQEEEHPRSIVMAEIMTPDKTNFGGNIHGGHLMQFFDKVAYACAIQYSSSYVVTLSVDGIFFKEPIFVGDLLMCYANINYVGRTSMEVGIRAEAKNLMTGQKRHTNSCYFTMVAVDENKKPKPVPPLKIRNEIEQQRFNAAEARKAMRLELYKKQLSY
jgi:acyl-CoA hydrolase